MNRDLTGSQEAVDMAAAHSPPDLEAYSEAIRMTQSQLVTKLRGLLGVKLVAYLGKAKEARAVRQWADGTCVMGDDTDVERLRIAYRAVLMITERDTSEVAQAWMQGLNPLLGDQAPALLLREGGITDVGPKVLAAARQFTAVG